MSKPKPRGPEPKLIPSPDSIIESSVIVSPKGQIYKVLRTNQVDPYDHSIKPRKSGKRRRRPPTE